MRHALLVTLSSPRYFRQLNIWPKAWPWLVILAVLLLFSLFVSNSMWLLTWLQGRDDRALRLESVRLENKNQEYQLTILAMQNRLQQLSMQRTQMQAELEAMRLDKANWQAGWLNLQALLGKEQLLADSVQGVAVVNDAWQKLDAMQQIPAGWPLATKSRVTSAYGMRMHPIEKALKKHNGIDLACNKGEEVLTTAPGVVSESHYTKGFGHQVTVTHNFGFRSRYAHLQQRQVNIGQWVDKHEVIGLCGQSGLANGPHLHYEVRYLTSALNPALFINWQLDQFDRLVTNTGGIIPWPSLLKQIASRPHLINNLTTASP